MRLFSAMLGAAAALGLFGNAASVSAGKLKFESRPGRHTHLVELYTSEGCSSCPPAEGWLSKLVASPKLWTEVVPVALHVDYWDNPGWHDRFATPAWTARQRAYAQAWGNTSIYTPALVLDGREWQDWNRSRPDTLPEAEVGRRSTGHLSAVVKDGKTLTVVYQPLDQPAKGLKVTVAVLGCDLNSSVKAGENRGRSVRHDFVVLTCETKNLSAGQGDRTTRFDLQMPTGDVGHPALAVWVEEPGRDGVRQAVGGWLGSPPPALP